MKLHSITTLAVVFGFFALSPVLGDISPLASSTAYAAKPVKGTSGGPSGESSPIDSDIAKKAANKHPSHSKVGKIHNPAKPHAGKCTTKVCTKTNKK